MIDETAEIRFDTSNKFFNDYVEYRNKVNSKK